MAIHVDSRGYRYVGSQVAHVVGNVAFGLAAHSSTEGGGPSTSQFGTAAEAVYGPGHWAVTGSSPTWTSFGGIFHDIIWSPSSITVGPVLVTGYSASTVGIPDSKVDEFVFGFNVRGTAGSQVRVCQINSDVGNTDVGARRTNGFDAVNFAQRDQFWISMGPNHLGLFGKDATSNFNFIWSGVLQGGNLNAALSRYVFSEFGTTDNAFGSTNAYRVQSEGSTTGQRINAGFTYSDSLALNPNTTGEPYITRYYPTDFNGTFAGQSGGYCEDLYVYHGTDISEGTIINTADLTPGGSFDFGNLDGSDFTNVICVGRDSGNTKRYVMRIGTDG